MFITIEGADFSGKTTMSNVIKDYFERMGQAVLLTREPGGTTIGATIRKILTEEDLVNDPLSVSTQILLLYAARIHHVNTVIIPALNNGKVVISDRFIDSTLVYQGLMYEHSDMIDTLTNAHKLRYLRERPDYTFYYDIDHSTLLDRMKERSDHNSLDIKYAKLGETPLDCFKQHFYELSQSNPYSVKIIDANGSMNVVKDTTLQLIKKCHLLYTNQRFKKNKSDHLNYLDRVKSCT
jgi:dTMP kinase